MLNAVNIKDNADKLLYDLGLLEELKKYGTPHIIGSYTIDAMACNDLDIDVTNENMSTEKLYRLTSAILEKYKPIWYEAKEEITADNKTVWFHGFETMILGELWNIDIWFFDCETIKKAENFCKKIKYELAADKTKREAVIKIRKDLIGKSLYSFDKYNSMDIYKAVLENGVLTTEEFLLCSNNLN